MAQAAINNADMATNDHAPPMDTEVHGSDACNSNPIGDTTQDDMHASPGVELPDITSQNMDYKDAVDLLLACSTDTTTEVESPSQPPAFGRRGDHPPTKGVKASSINPELAESDSGSDSQSSDSEDESASGDASQSTSDTKTVVFKKEKQKQKKSSTLIEKLRAAQLSVRQAGAIARLRKEFGIEDIEELLAMLKAELDRAGIDTRLMFCDTTNRNEVAKFILHHAILFEWLKKNTNNPATMPLVYAVLGKLSEYHNEMIEARALGLAEEVVKEKTQALREEVGRLKRKKKELKAELKAEKNNRRFGNSTPAGKAKKALPKSSVANLV